MLRNVQDMNYADIEKGIAALGEEERGTLERALEILDDLARSEGPSMPD